MTNTSEKYERTQQGNLLEARWFTEVLEGGPPRSRVSMNLSRLYPTSYTYHTKNLINMRAHYKLVKVSQYIQYIQHYFA